MNPIRASLIIVRYPKGLGWAGFLSMAIFRFPLFLNDFSFWKLMGCGKNGTFDKRPDWHQWAVLLVKKTDENIIPPRFLLAWWRLFNCRKWILQLEPIEGHGTWDRQYCFGELPKQTDYDGQIAILTRATIRLPQLKRFWQHVNVVAERMHTAPGFVTSVGIGEIPWIKQATFSIWQNKDSMQQFAYRMREHADVIRKTRAEKWYREEMFVRFRILAEQGSLTP